MENASRALLMAGAILIAVLIITVIVMVFRNTSEVTRTYDQTISAEQVATFNSNFTKYLNKELTIYDVVTICNFATQNKLHSMEERQISGFKAEKNIKDDLSEITEVTEIVNGQEVKKRQQITYELKINGYDSNGYVSNIQFINKGLKTID